jgi:C4-dicarboxylate-specific signal transduction histidine kinase
MIESRDEVQIQEADTAAFGDVATALSLLSAEVIHEVTHTLNFLRFLLQQAPPGDAGTEMPRFANTEIERMQRMVGHLRRFKLPAPQPTEVSLSEVVERSIARVQEPVARQDPPIESRVRSDVWVRTDVECLASALRNLLLEARDRAPAGAALVITAEAPTQQPLHLDISDEGAALPDHAAAAPDWWDVGPPQTPRCRRVLAHWLLQHIGWSMSYERREQRNVFRLTAPMPMRPPL